MMGILRTGGFSIDLLHHAMHVIGSRLLGFSQELYDDTASMPAEEAAAMWSQLADRYPNIVQLVSAISHDEGAVVGGGCDDQFEFELALDLILDGLERLRASEGRASRGASRTWGSCYSALAGASALRTNATTSRSRRWSDARPLSSPTTALSTLASVSEPTTAV